MPALRLTHVGLCVSDLARARRFYEDALGFEAVSALEASGEAAAALLAARARPRPTRGRRQKNAWVLLTEVAPELAEWATFFSAGAAKRAAAEAGSRRAVTERETDDLVRDADRFLAVVEQSLGLVPHAVGAGTVLPTGRLVEHRAG